jgi:hypothetical protein
MSNKELKFEWKCPKCGAKADEHGKGGIAECKDWLGSRSRCKGLICECAQDTGSVHGETFSDRCHHATCYHCGWLGTMPRPLNNIEDWEQKALESGWIPPEEWAKTHVPTEKGPHPEQPDPFPQAD